MLVVVSAPSGAGKTSLCHEIRSVIPDLAYSISHTTRPPRPGEVSGQDFHFVSEAAFRGMVARNEFAEWATVHGNLYGTGKRALDQLLNAGCDVLLDIDTQGARQLRTNYPEGVYVFVAAPSLRELEQRLRERKSDAPQEIQRRLARAREEIQAWREYDYLIINRDLKEAVNDLAAVIQAERCRTRRLRLKLPDLELPD
jgi:guanylate kinase